MQYDLDINDIDSVQFVNHYMPLETDMQILTDDEFDNKLEELLDFVFGPEPIIQTMFGIQWIFKLNKHYNAIETKMLNRNQALC